MVLTAQGIDLLRRKKSGVGAAIAQPVQIQNPYAAGSPARQAATTAFTAALQPQIRKATDVVTSSVSPWMTGRVGASLLRDVQAPATRALSEFELEQEKKGMDYAAELPFREAALTGKYGGGETLAGRGLGLQEKEQEKRWSELTPAQKAQLEQAKREEELGLWKTGGDILGKLFSGGEGGGGIDLGSIGKTIGDIGGTAGEWLGGLGSIAGQAAGGVGSALGGLGSAAGSALGGLGSVAGGVGSALGGLAGAALPIAGAGALTKAGLEAITGRPMQWGWEGGGGATLKGVPLDQVLAQRQAANNPLAQTMFGKNYADLSLKEKNQVMTEDWKRRRKEAGLSV